MANPTTWRARRTNFLHRVHARRAGRLPAATAFVSAPEPRTIGNVARGRQLIAGNFLFSGFLVESTEVSIWDVGTEDPAVTAEIHGCTWLDDLAAIGNDKARLRAQTWVGEWIDRYGRGTGPGWTPDLTGRRLIRWINHGFFLFRGQEKAATQRLYRSLARQTVFLSKRWRTASPGLPRFEALAGMVYASLSLEGMDTYVQPAVEALAKDCETRIDAGGGIATRNPEELLHILGLLNWTVLALNDTGNRVPTQILAAVARVAPVLRALRHGDGGLARFHGGGRGPEGRLDEALAGSGVKDLPGPGPQMGFIRLNSGRSSLVVDAAAPPAGPVSANAHASTLGFELTSGRRPLIVNCGSGIRFGAEWRRASRATPSHSTLGIEGVSSSELVTGLNLLAKTPDQVLCNASQSDDVRKLELSHDGYRPSHGLTHARVLELSLDGRSLDGEDLLTTLSSEDEKQFGSVHDQPPLPGVPYAIRFHLHPDVTASLDMAGTAVSMVLKSGETWVFRHDGIAEMTLAPSVYLEIGRLKPRTSQQVVLSGRAMAYATRIRWSLAKSQNTPDVVRDLVQADLADQID